MIPNILSSTQQKSIKPHTIPASVYLLGNQPTFVIDPDDADVVHTTQTQSQLNPNSRCWWVERFHIRILALERRLPSN